MQNAPGPSSALKTDNAARFNALARAFRDETLTQTELMARFKTLFEFDKLSNADKMGLAKEILDAVKEKLGEYVANTPATYDDRAEVPALTLMYPALDILTSLQVSRFAPDGASKTMDEIFEKAAAKQALPGALRGDPSQPLQGYAMDMSTIADWTWRAAREFEAAEDKKALGATSTPFIGVRM